MVPPFDDANTTDSTAAAPPPVIGFKTVRFLRDHAAAQDPAYVDFLTQTFPCARFVVNIRSDLEALRASQRTAFGRNGVANLTDDLARLRWIGERLGPERAYVLDSTEWTQNVTQLNAMVRWLGYSSPACDFTDVLELNTVHKYKNGKESLATTRSADCRYVGTTTT